MKDIDQIRRENMRTIEEEMGSASIAANAIGMTLAQFLNLRDGAKDSKTGIPRGMRKATAWKIEDGAKKPRGWLDIDHKDSPQRSISSLAVSMFAVRCAKCGEVSHKSFMELELNDTLPCSCGATISVADYYGQSDLEKILKGLGGDGFVLRKRDKI